MLAMIRFLTLALKDMIMTNEEDVFSPDSLMSRIERITYRLREQEAIMTWVLDNLLEILKETGTPEQNEKILAVLNKAAEMTGPEDTND